MGKIKKILESELIGGTQSADVYPVTSIKAVYDENNERLDNILNRRGVVNISTNYNTDHIAEVLTLEQAIAKVPSKDRVLGFQGKFLSENGWKSYIFIGDSIADWTNKTKWNNYLTGTDVVQEPGDSEDKVVSQKALNDALNLKADQSFVNEALAKKADKETVKTELAKKFDKENIAQEFGDSEDKVVSQSALPFRYIQSEEFIFAKVDGNDKLLFGIQWDGTPVFGKTSAVEDRLQLQVTLLAERVATIMGDEDTTNVIDTMNELKKFFAEIENTETLTGILANLDNVVKNLDKTTIKDEEGNVQDTPFRVIENEEFIMAVVDSEDRYLFGIYRDSGKPYFPLNEMYHVEQNEEFFAVWLDAAKHVLLGIRRDGEIIGEIHAVNALKQVISRVQANVASLQEGKVDKEKGKSLIDDEVKNSLKVIENEKFIYAITDAEDKILEGTDIYGRKHIDTLTVNNLNVNDKNSLYLQSFVDLIYESEKINSGVTLFTQETIKEDDVLFVEFTSNSSPFCIRFNDKDGNRLNWCGISSNIANLNFKQTLVVPKNYTNAVSAWGNALNLKIYRLRKEGSDRLYSCLNNILEGNIDYMKFKEYWIPSYLKDEMLQTIDKLDELTVKPAFVMPILTDSHVGITARSQEMTQETLACLRYLCSHCSVDAIAHLGDLVDSDVWNYFPDNVKCYTIMQNYLMQFAEINTHSYIVNGNHDGRGLNSFYSSRWYSMIGRKISSDSTVIKDSEEAAYYYVEHPKCKLCCIFMSIPDSYNNTAPTWGWTSQQLKWFANVLANVKTGYQVMIFAHILPFEANSTNNSTHTLVNVETFYGIVRAFNNHTTYSDSLVTVDFTEISNSKIVCYFAGHEHSEKVWRAGESYNGKYTDNYKDYFDFTYVNNMPCSAVGLTETCYSYNDTVSIDNMGQTLVLRKEKTALQEAWDILVYRPDLKRIYLIRFGSGEDREIDLTDLI